MNDNTQALSQEDLVQFKMLLETLFDLGFLAAKTNCCHLLFAAWNTSGKSSSYDDVIWSKLSSAAKIKTFGYPCALTGLCNDVCGIYQSLGFDDDYMPDTLFTKLLQEKDEKKKQSSLKKSASVILCQGMKEGLLLLSSRIADLTKDITNLSTPLYAFALLEALP
eukprot:11521912-Ditylum_brightwellii.AAC.1